jgi:serine/threonine protein kinase
MNRIQLIEADAKHEEVLRSQLAGQGFQVIVSYNIEDARKQLHEIVPDLLVISLNTDDPLFFEFYRWLCHTFPWSKIPRLFISGDKLTEIARELEIEENEEIFSKPIEIGRFISTIKKLSAIRDGAFKKIDEDYLAAVPGRKIGSVIIKEEIGRGGMGAVFLGYQETLERKVAVKLLLPDKIGDPFAVQRFQREAVAIAGLKSPHIVQIFDFGEIDHNVFYISMEYLEGKTIEQYVEMQKKLSIDKALPIVFQVARGLIAAHDAGMVHRDIKPSNLIMNKKNHVTITDFGLVQSQENFEKTQSGTIAGSPHYMPPEQASGDPMDARSDIYSLGIIFFRLLVGKVPFTGENPVKIMLRHMNEPLPDPREFVPGIPGKIAGIIKKMTEKNRVNRYSDCRKLLAEMESISPYNDNTIVAPFLRKQSPDTVKIEKADIDADFEKKFLELSSLLPTLFSREKLLATITMTPAGTFINPQGEFPGEWKNSLFLLRENIKQVNVAADLGRWRFLIVNTQDKLAALLPGDVDVEVIFLDKSDSEMISKTAIFDKGVDRQKETGVDPIRQLSSIAGVRRIFLFDSEGVLAAYRQADGRRIEDYGSRLSPAALLIQSVPLEISSMDMWFEKGRVLIRKIAAGTLFVIADPDISYSMLSIFIDSNLGRLSKAVQKKKTRTSEKIGQSRELEGTAPAHMLDRIQSEFVRMIGPIGKVVFEKAIRRSGYGKDRFPFSQAPELIEELAKKIGPGEQQVFKDKIRNLINNFKGKRQ